MQKGTVRLTKGEQASVGLDNSNAPRQLRSARAAVLACPQAAARNGTELPTGMLSHTPISCSRCPTVPSFVAQRIARQRRLKYFRISFSRLRPFAPVFFQLYADAAYLGLCVQEGALHHTRLALRYNTPHSHTTRERAHSCRTKRRSPGMIVSKPEADHHQIITSSTRGLSHSDG